LSVKSAAIGIVGAVLAATVVWLLWSFNYALVYRFYTKDWKVWMALMARGDLTLPVEQAWTYWGDPFVMKIVTRATMFAGVEALVLFGAIGVAMSEFASGKPPKGGARLASMGDLRSAELLDGRPGYSVLLGRFKGKDIRDSGDSHIYVNGPTGAGKGVGFVLPNGFEWRGSLVGFDVKLEMWDQVGPARRAMGQRVFVFAPGSEKSHRWNPLDFVRDWPMRATDLSNLARSLVPAAQHGDSYWTDSARGLLAGVLGYVLESETMKECRTIRGALRLFSTGTDLSELLLTLIDREPSLNSFIVNKFRQHAGGEKKQRAAFEKHVTTSLDAWNNELIASATNASDFDIRELRRKPFSVFLGCPAGDLGTVEAVVRLFIQQIHDVLMWSLPGPDEPHKILMMLDEFYQFGRLAEIVDRAPLVRGYGFRIAIISQGLSGLDVRYGKPVREMIMANCDIKLAVGIGDEATADYWSKALGAHYVEQESWGASMGSGRWNRSRNKSWRKQPLLSPDELMRFDKSKAVLLARGHDGASIDKIFTPTDKGFQKKKADAAPFEALLESPKLDRLRESALFANDNAHGRV
jgi:type IV secretion system protein VirD4